MAVLRKQGRVIRKNSILWKISIIMFGALLVQFVLLYCAVFFGSTMSTLEKYAFDIFQEKVTGCRNDLEDDMVQRWGNLREPAERIHKTVANTLAAKGTSYRALASDSEVTQEVLAAVSEDLIYTLRRNAVTGVFLILNGGETSARPAEGEVERRPGLYMRDLDPQFDSDHNSDLLIERGPSDLTKEFGIPMDTFWSPQFQLDASQDFFYNPMEAALANPTADAMDLGYWCPSFRLKDDETSIITYSIPLFTEENVPYGVLGIEVTADHIVRCLPYTELGADKRGSYLLAVGGAEDAEYHDVIASGPYYKHIFGTRDSIRLNGGPLYDDMTLAEHEERIEGEVCASVKTLKLYNNNTPFAGEEWSVIGVIEKSDLLSLYESIRRNILLVFVLVFLIGAAGFFLAAKLFTRPIVRLSHRVREFDPSEPVRLERTNIAEIDELSQAIESLGRSVAENASKLSQIVQMTEYAIGAFEYRRNTDQFFFTDGFFELIGMEDHLPENRRLSSEEVRGLLADLMDGFERAGSDGENIYRVGGAAQPRWVKLKLVEDPGKILGVVSDVTSEFIEKRKIEHERDHDPMTDLMNRRAFHTELARLFAGPRRIETGAMLMFDLDNLKYVNDTYGHDCGDQYICAAAEVLHRFSAPDVLVSRVSGDEFYVFLYGGGHAEIQEKIARIEASFKRARFRLPDGQTAKIRVSAGIAWYPQDADSYDRLIQYADFAMYRVKHTLKGRFASFDLENYHRESYLLHNKEEINKLIEGEFVDYNFQAIVNARDGSVFGYEALMRPLLPSMSSPGDVLALARSQSKLYDIERLTWFRAMAFFSRLSPAGGECRVFINSIPNQVLTEEDIHDFERRYKDYLPRIVIELTEEEKLDDSFLIKKQYCANSWGGALALDDFGAGYNSESLLLKIEPQYIKIDRTIIQGIDRDESRLRLFRNLASYAREHDMLVIAEGVETQAEMRTLVANGADYLQGFYLSRPESHLGGPDEALVQEIRAAAQAAEAERARVE